MEAKVAEGSMIIQINPQKASENAVDTVDFSGDNAKVGEQEKQAAPVADRDMHLTNKVIEVEGKLKLAQEKIEELEIELMQAKTTSHMHAREKQEQVISFEGKLHTAEKEREDILTLQEKLKVVEIEATRLRTELSDSKSMIAQLMCDAAVAAEKLDEMYKNVLALKEKEAMLLEQLAAAEFRTKIVEEKFHMQTELLQEKMKMRAQKGDELDEAETTFNKQEMDLTQFTELFLNLEDKLKSAIDKTEKYGKLAKLNEDNDVKEIEEDTSTEKLSAISESRAIKLEQTVASLQGLCETISLSEQKEGAGKKTESKLFTVEDELNHSQEHASELGQNLSSDEILMEDEGKFIALELDLKIAKQREINLQAKLKDSEEKLAVQENILRETTSRCMEVERLLESQTKDAEAEHLEAIMLADSETKRLSEKLKLLEAQLKEPEDQTAQAFASAAASQMKEMEQRRDTGRSLSLLLYNTINKTKIMSKDQTVPTCDTRDKWVIKISQCLNLNYTFVLGVAFCSILIGLVIGKHF